MVRGMGQYPYAAWQNGNGPCPNVGAETKAARTTKSARFRNYASGTMRDRRSPSESSLPRALFTQNTVPSGATTR